MTTADPRAEAPVPPRAAGREGALRCAVIVNAGAGSAGGDDVSARIRAAFEAAGADAVVLDVAGHDLAALARRAASDPSLDAVVAAGGDGTVSAVAGALAGTEKALGVLPLGTLNHFAKDLGVPESLEEAAAAIARAAPRRVDVGEVNGRVFVNNSSIGVYPRIVRERERLRARVGAWLGKWLAMIWAAVAVILRLRPLSMRIRWDGGGEAPRRTTLLFVGNNRYDTAAMATQRRARLDGGALGVYVGRARTRVGLFRLALRSVAGRVDDRHLEALDVERLTVETHRRWLDVAVDGEVVRLRPPIRYAIRPGALRVLAPAPTP